MDLSEKMKLIRRHLSQEEMADKYRRPHCEKVIFTVCGFITCFLRYSCSCCLMQRVTVQDEDVEIVLSR
jgi:hypothetical protein